jgi:SAM-dependent methyltransferase
MEHSQQIERAFTTQADAVEDASRNQVFTSDARWVFERLPLSTGDLVLDVAAGTGHAARQLAATARAVVALDATEAMPARGQTQALLTEAGLEAVEVVTRPLERPLTPWLEQAQTDGAAGEEIRAALEAELAGETTTGFRPRSGDDGELRFVQTFGSAIARKPS